MLRPGVHVLRRSAEELQVGLHPDRALILPDRPAVRALLASLNSPASLPLEGYDARTIELLTEAGLLVDADALLRLVPSRPPATGPAGPEGPGRESVSRSGVAAVAAESGDAAAALLEARARSSVEVAVCGSPEARQVAATLSTLLADSGVPHRLREASDRSDRVCHTGRRPSSTAGTTTVLVAVGEPAREVTDDLMRDGIPHLVLRLTEGHAVLGPFVRPAETACLRCIDAHHTDVDRSWPLLVAQYATAVTRGREDTVPEPVDPVLATLAAAWAARELVTHAEGGEPATTSATIRLDPRLTALETQTWPRHPACGCSWG